MEEPKKKRNRRTRAELEAGVFDAVRQLASEKGLAQITFTDIMQRAGIQNVRPAQKLQEHRSGTG